MKFLLLVVVIGIGLFFLLGRRRPSEPPPGAGRAAPPEPAVKAMVACAHCGVHLPRDDALLDNAGRPFCGEAHRIAGPR